jgi:hydrogenase-4 component E
MMLDPRTASGLVDAFAAAIVVLGVGIASTRSLGRMIWVTAIQSALVGAAAITVAAATGIEHLAVGGTLAIVVKGVVVPLVLGSILRQSSVRQERRPIVSPRISFLLAVGIVFVATTATREVHLSVSLGAARALPASISTLLTGLLIVMTRRKTLSLVVGLLVFENGIALAAFSLVYAMPLVVELGVLFDLLIVVVVAWVYARRMLDVFGTLSTDELRNLRG